MRKYTLLMIALAGLMFSCHEELVLETGGEDDLDLSPYCTYTVDGIVYECDRSSGWANGNLPVNPIDGKAYEDYDTLFHFNMSGLSKPMSALLEINIGKKFAIRDMIPRYNRFYKLSHKDREAFLVEGSYPFSSDFIRQNTQDGVALKIEANIEGLRKTLTTYSNVSLDYPTAVRAGSQKDSFFTITKIHQRPNGAFVVEAEFEALFFGPEYDKPTETIKKVKGKARFPFTWAE